MSFVDAIGAYVAVVLLSLWEKVNSGSSCAAILNGLPWASFSCLNWSILSTLSQLFFFYDRRNICLLFKHQLFCSYPNWLLEFGSGTDYVEWVQTPWGKSSVLYRLPPLWTPASSSWGFQATHNSDQMTTNLGVPRIPSGSIIYLEWFTELGKCYTYKKYISGTTKWRDIKGEMWEVLDAEFLCSSPHRIREHHPPRAHQCIHQPRAPPSLGAQSFYWGSS